MQVSIVRISSQFDQIPARQLAVLGNIAKFSVSLYMTKFLPVIEAITWDSLREPRTDSEHINTHK